MKTEIKIRGLKELIRNLKTLEINVERAARDALWEAGAFLEGALKRKLSKPGTGRVYRTGRAGRRYAFHRASIPGMYPAIMTGRLRASITHNVTGKVGTKLPDPGGSLKGGVVKAYVGTNVGYGYFLERGTSRMRPRPWLYVTVNALKGRIERIIRKRISTTIAKAKARAA